MQIKYLKTMSKFLDYTGLSHVINKINELFFKKTEALEVTGIDTYLVQSVGIDNIPTQNSDNLITSGGVYQTVNNLSNMINISYTELKELHENEQLNPGCFYRIIDYVTTTTQEDTRSANHPFDIIVLALDEKTLSENASAIQHEGDTYFSNCDLNAWKLKYCLDNDTDRFIWADAINGCGVIYYMKDESMNECFYDFKNIQFKPGTKTIAGTIDDVFYYTFSVVSGTNDAVVKDYSLRSDYCHRNKIGVCVNNSYAISSIRYSLPNNVFRNTSTDYCSNNILGDSCDSNIFGGGCCSNILGNGCNSNVFGDFCNFNVLSVNCEHNNFGQVFNHNYLNNNCYYNTFENYCYGNIIGENCHHNVFKDDCNSNKIGNNCANINANAALMFNIIGNSCEDITFGVYCKCNIFENECWHIILGNGCNFNNFKNNCNNIKFGTSDSTKSYYNNIIIENGNQYIYLSCTGTTSDYIPYQNVTIAQGVNNTSTYKTITDSNVGQTYKTTYQPTNSQIISI